MLQHLIMGRPKIGKSLPLQALSDPPLQLEVREAKQQTNLHRLLRAKLLD
jgi:hypothetical protein